MKKLIALLLALASLLMFSGCASKNGGGSSGTVTVTDHCGYTVEVPTEINRIAICGIYPLASVLTVFFNSAEKIVAMPLASLTAAKNGLLGQLYPEILNVETDCVSGSEINVEELMKLEPDVVFYSDTDTATGEMLRNAGFVAVGLSVSKWNYNCIETLDNWIALLSEMFPQDAKADIAKEKSAEVYAMVTERTADIPEDEKARIFVIFQYTETTMLTSGKNFFGQFWCDAVGAVNVAEELANDNSVAVNMEQVYAWNPSVVLITNFTTAQPDDLYNNTVGEYLWTGIDAVDNGRVYKMPLGMYRSYTPGVDTPVTLLWLAKTVYPDLFADIDVTAEAKAYYKDVFGIELTDEQIESIFTPVSSAAEGVGN